VPGTDLPIYALRALRWRRTPTVLQQRRNSNLSPGAPRPVTSSSSLRRVTSREPQPVRSPLHQIAQRPVLKVPGTDLPIYALRALRRRRTPTVLQQRRHSDPSPGAPRPVASSSSLRRVTSREPQPVRSPSHQIAQRPESDELPHLHNSWRPTLPCQDLDVDVEVLTGQIQPLQGAVPRTPPRGVPSQLVDLRTLPPPQPLSLFVGRTAETPPRKSTWTSRAPFLTSNSRQRGPIPPKSAVRCLAPFLT
jgi:hypothetical protein